MAVKEKIRIRIKGYDHQLVDQSAEKIVETARRTGARVSGPVPLPTEKEVVTILRAVHKYKDSREQFETRTHKRLIDILRPSNKTVEALMGLELLAGKSANCNTVCGFSGEVMFPCFGKAAAAPAQGCRQRSARKRRNQ